MMLSYRPKIYAHFLFCIQRMISNASQSNIDAADGEEENSQQMDFHNFEYIHEGLSNKWLLFVIEYVSIQPHNMQQINCS